MPSIPKIRTFIAVHIPELNLKKIAELQQRLKRQGGDIKWVRPESMHITLKFLGDVNQNQIPSIADSITGAVRNISRFSVSIEGTGTFPNDRRPRVIWTGVREGADVLITLAKRVDKVCSAIGFETETRPYKPHLTLGRVRSVKNIQSTIDTLNRDMFHAGVFDVNSIFIMKSDLKPQGAVYSVLKTIKLEG